jgi:chitin synthase
LSHSLCASQEELIDTFEADPSIAQDQATKPQSIETLSRKKTVTIRAKPLVIDVSGLPVQSNTALPSSSHVSSLNAGTAKSDNSADKSDAIVQLVGGVPSSTLNRTGTYRQKTVPLVNGKIAIDCPLPPELLAQYKFPNVDEFKYSRYTPITGDPDDFEEQKYSLRPLQYGRKTDLFVVVTMYNEDDELFCRTIYSLMQNVAYLCSKYSAGWDKDGWQRVVVCIVSDGRAKCHPRVLDVLRVMGIYHDVILKDVAGKEVSAHLFEHTTHVAMDDEFQLWNHKDGVFPVQVMFCLKEKNAKKLNSHRWFFNAFSRVLKPDVCILIDVGTKPTPNSLFELWKAFDECPNLGGACGEIVADLGGKWENLRNPIVASQNFEYKISNILDKTLESVCGYISVLPGAFSAYRYSALKDVSPGVGPLSSYFKGEESKQNKDTWSIFDANMYLAEDRILCFELFSKKRERWLLRYVRVS